MNVSKNTCKTAKMVPPKKPMKIQDDAIALSNTHIPFLLHSSREKPSKDAHRGMHCA
jgi:hypothetical protein